MRFPSDFRRGKLAQQPIWQHRRPFLRSPRYEITKLCTTKDDPRVLDTYAIFNAYLRLVHMINSSALNIAEPIDSEKAH